MPWTDILSPAVVIAVVVLLWRDTNSRIMALGRTVADVEQRLNASIIDVDRRVADVEQRLNASIADVEQRLNASIADVDRRVAAVEQRLNASIVDVDRRLATLEGRIAGWQDHQHAPAAPTE